MDKGPWESWDFPTENGGRKYGVTSDDLTHDVWLEVHGNFESVEQRRLYCDWLADKLNGRAVPQTPEPK